MAPVPSVRLAVDRVGVATVTLDRPGESLNTLGPDIVEEVAEVIGRCETDPAIRAVVIESGKPDSFVAGGDIRWLRTLDDPAATRSTFRELHGVFLRLESLWKVHGKPVVAAVHGPCLGGGLELALSCSDIVATDHARTRFGQPEVKLGLIPGAGGTQRLPRKVGLAVGLDLILTGRSLRPRRALAAGLVAELCEPVALHATARALAVRRIGRVDQRKGRARLRDPLRLLERVPSGAKAIMARAERHMLAATKGHYPAPPAALRAVRAGYEEGLEAGFAREIDEFSALPGTLEAQALISLFFATQASKGAAGEGTPRKTEVVGIVGGGLMGAGIAAVNAMRARVRTVLKEIDQASADAAVARVTSSVEEASKRRGRKPPPLRELLDCTSDMGDLASADIVIEAVYEDLGLKRRVLAEVEAVTGPSTVFASNTSSIPIADIAAEAGRPENVLGLHYFSPVEKMPLLEVIATELTSPDAIATGVSLGDKQGKTVIVVGDGPGFYTTRILAPYAAEVFHLLEDGATVDEIDAAMVDWGFPIGPLALADEVGIDVGAKIAHVLEHAMAARLPAPGAFEALVADGRAGKKNGHGFYRYERGKRRGVDESVYAVLGVDPTPGSVPAAEIQDRLFLRMANEAVRCLEEGVLRSAADGDVGAVFGIGFPPFRGGPFFSIDSRGVENTLSAMESLEARLGLRFEAAKLLQEHAAKGARFRSDG
jgi:3-hydroxyacyl-CoA dehydrogenase/enoyl-CoA hydratase/3-hydroxybutyryl-CoA epimerase